MQLQLCVTTGRSHLKVYLDLQGGSLTGSHKSVLTGDLGSSTGTSPHGCLVILECGVVTGFHQESRTLKQKPSVTCLRSHIPVCSIVLVQRASPVPCGRGLRWRVTSRRRGGPGAILESAFHNEASLFFKTLPQHFVRQLHRSVSRLHLLQPLILVTVITEKCTSQSYTQSSGRHALLALLSHDINFYSATYQLHRF